MSEDKQYPAPQTQVVGDALLQQNLRDSFDAMCAMRDAIAGMTEDQI